MATNRLSQLSERMNSDYTRSGVAMKERGSLLQQKMQGLGGRIAKTKQADDDRLIPIYSMLERTGEDLQKEGEIIQQIDQRLDQELHAMKARQSDEIEWLLKNRGQAKVRLNSQISTACDLLTQEFMDNKDWARKYANQRWDGTINKVATVIDNLEAERKNRIRAETRLYDTVNAKMEVADSPVSEEVKHREEMQAATDEKIEESALKMQLLMQEDKKERHENAKVTMQQFREAMTKLAGHIDNEATDRETAEADLVDKLSHSIGQLAGCIEQEAKVREDSEAQMMKLLEDMSVKLTAEVKREKDERQQTERVLTGLLEESVEAIALRANDDTVSMLKKRRDERSMAREERESEMKGRQNYWAAKFQEEKDLAKERYKLET